MARPEVSKDAHAAADRVRGEYVLAVVGEVAARSGETVNPNLATGKIEVLAKAMHTNPVVLRRVMAGLRDRGFVRSEKGHGGGWTLARDLSEITLRAGDVQKYRIAMTQEGMYLKRAGLGY